MSNTPPAERHAIFERKKPKYLFMFSDWQQFLTDAMTPLLDLLKLERLETYLQKLHNAPNKPLEFFLANRYTEILFMDSFQHMEEFQEICRTDPLKLVLVPDTVVVSVEGAQVDFLNDRDKRLIVFGIENELWAVTGNRRAIINYLDAERTDALSFASGSAPVKMRDGSIKELREGTLKDVDLREFDFIMKMILGDDVNAPNDYANITNTQFVGVPQKVVDVHQDWSFIVLVRHEENLKQKRLH